MQEQDQQDRYDYVILGGGMTADAAARGIRERDEQGSIAIVGEETSAPFPRPALSKKLWTDADFDKEGAALGTEEETGATLLLGRRVTEVDTEAHQVTCDDGTTVTYGKLLLATGGRPRTLDGVPAGDRVIYFRTLADYERLRALAADGPRVAVVGAGYIGSELAAALVQHDCEVTLLHPGEVLGGHLYPERLAADVERAFTDAGVVVRGGSEVERVETGEDGTALVVHLADSDETVEVDVVVLGLGIEPSSDYLGVEVDRADDGGVVVDSSLATSVPDVWAAGDLASYPDKIMGQRRVEHVDNAETMGATVGRVMAGSDETYDHTPMFYSDLFDHWYEAIGEATTSLETVEDRFGNGSEVVYYLDDDRVRGVLLWDCDGGLEEATELLATHDRPADPQDLVGRIRP